MNTNAPEPSPVAIGYRAERVFDFDEALALIPVINRVTRRYFDEVEESRARLETLLPCDPRSVALSAAIEEPIRRWKMHMESIGLKVYGLWEVGFFNAEDYWWFEYGARTIRYRIANDEQPNAKRAIARSEFIAD